VQDALSKESSLEIEAAEVMNIPLFYEDFIKLLNKKQGKNRARENPSPARDERKTLET